MKLDWKLFKTDRGMEPAVRPRFSSKKSTSYTLKAEDVLAWPGMPLAWLSRKFYGSIDFEDVIFDANPIKPPWEYQIGDVVIIPLDFRQAGATSASPDLRALVRKIR